MQESLEQQVEQVSCLLEQNLLPPSLVPQASRLQVRTDHTPLIHSGDVNSEVWMLDALVLLLTCRATWTELSDASAASLRG